MYKTIIFPNMKKSFFLILALFFVLTACQKEEYEVITEQDQNSITTDMETYDLIYRLAMYDGSEDDEIDDNPCFSLVFPYTLSFQGREINISNNIDRISFIESLPANINYHDLIPDFPVTVINSGHQRVTVMNRQQFAGLQQACRNFINERGGPITCMKFTFPVRINSYNRPSQQVGSSTLNSQEELFNYFDNLIASDVVSFEFPLEVRIGNRSITVNNGTALVDYIKNCEEVE